MIFGLFGMKNEKKVDDEELRKTVATIIFGFDSAIEQVRKLETIGKHDEAKKLLLIMTKTCVLALKNNPDGFHTLIQLAHALHDRDYKEQFVQVLNALKDNPKDKTESELHVLMGFTSVAIAEAVSSKDKRQSLIVYLCQKCAGLIPYLATPCTDCGFLPTSTEEIKLGCFLSTNKIYYSQLATIGGSLRDGLPITRITNDFEDRFTKFKSDPISIRFVDTILKLRAEPGIKRVIDNFKPIIAMGKCNTCGKETHFFSSHIFCKHCRSCDVYVPELMKYKKCLADVLFWLEEVCAPVEHSDFALFIYKLALYKARAVELGHVMTKEQGEEVRQALLNIQKFPFGDGSLVLTVLGTSITVDKIPNSEPTQQKDKSVLFNEGVALFKNLLLYCENGLRLG
jgi:hypothetical protein